MSNKSYAEKLRDPRWQKRRLEVFESAKWKCEEPSCQSSDSELQVHHCHYMRGREPWEYGDDLLICHCDKCHRERQSIEGAIHLALSQVLRVMSISRLHKIAWKLISEAMEEQTI